ncbi:hypothetical protein [Flavobacterium taihuense]|uniref:Lipoprotein n=1 Tax=Flavobacterium taihuense TaxID=2857508 RepID=A0ABS6Y1N8_9FLAO|nr:hypothetical protein [Flavobacterium taihuense]MBW4362845.1 hypothetical protein [Flavobacterium taihuense]
MNKLIFFFFIIVYSCCSGQIKNNTKISNDFYINIKASENLEPHSDIKKTTTIVELNQKEQRKIYNYFQEYDYFNFPTELEIALSDCKNNKFSKFIKNDIIITVNYNSKKKIVFCQISNNDKTKYEAKKFLELYSKIWEIIRKKIEREDNSETEYYIY